MGKIPFLDVSNHPIYTYSNRIGALKWTKNVFISTQIENDKPIDIILYYKPTTPHVSGFGIWYTVTQPSYVQNSA
jgi:hypothetical protein